MIYNDFWIFLEFLLILPPHGELGELKKFPPKMGGRSFFHFPPMGETVRGEYISLPPHGKNREGGAKCASPPCGGRVFWGSKLSPHGPKGWGGSKKVLPPIAVGGKCDLWRRCPPPNEGDDGTQDGVESAEVRSWLLRKIYMVGRLGPLGSEKGGTASWNTPKPSPILLHLALVGYPDARPCPWAKGFSRTNCLHSTGC